jgi:hypothetical protein
MNHEPQTPSRDRQYFFNTNQYGIRCFFIELFRYAELMTIRYLNQKIDSGGMAPMAREIRQTVS